MISGCVADVAAPGNKFASVWTEDICKQFMSTTQGYTAIWNDFWRAVGAEAATEEAIENAQASAVILETVWRDHLVDGLFDLFTNRTDIWFRQYVSRAGKFGYTCKELDGQPLPELSKDILVQHLSNSLTLSLPAISSESTSKWLCFDSDTDAGYLDRISMVIESFGIVSFREGSRWDSVKKIQREGHLWLFFDAPIPAEDAVEINRFIVAQSGLVGTEVETYPKSKDKLSQVRMPLGSHQKVGAGQEIGWFEGTAKGGKTSQAAWLLDQPRNSSAGAMELAKLLRSSRPSAQHKASTLSFSRTGKSPINLLPYVGTVRKIGKDFAAACPLCRGENLDSHGDNLRISADGLRVNCVNGGPNTRHRSREIYQAFGL